MKRGIKEKKYVYMQHYIKCKYNETVRRKKKMTQMKKHPAKVMEEVYCTSNTLLLKKFT